MGPFRSASGIRSGLKCGLVAFSLVLLAGCGTLGKAGPRKNGEFFRQTHVENRPITWPVRSVSNFNDSLACMDQMLRDNHVAPVLITSKTIPDASGKVYVSAKDMVITSLSEMSRTSNAFRFVDYEVDPLRQDTVQTLSGILMQNSQMAIQMPQLYVSGSVSFMDQNVLIDQRSFGAATIEAEIGISRDLIGSIVGMELHLGDFITRTLIPGVHSANEIALSSKGVGYDAGGRIRKAGVQLEIGRDYSQGIGPTMRSLVDLSMIELVGKWTRLPYWQCISLDQSHPEFQRQLRDWFLEMSEGERVAFFQRGLRANGYNPGEGGSTITPQLRAAVRRFQLDSRMAVTGDLSFETYEILARRYVRTDGAGNFVRIGWGTPELANRLPRELAQLPREGAPSLDSMQPRPPKVQITLPTPGNARPLGEALLFNITVDRTSYLRCYYRDAAGSIAQIYPNPLQTAPLIEGNRSLMVPDASNPQSFSIQLTRPGAEELRCLATATDPSQKLPARLDQGALVPIRAKSLDALQQTYEEAMGGDVGEGRLSWRVMQ